MQYNTARVMSSVVKSDHKALVVMSRGAPTSIVKTRQQRTYRPKTPSQNASFLRHLATIDLTSRPDPHELARKADPQAVNDAFYASATGLLDAFYPERTVTVTSRDPSYVTSEIKAKFEAEEQANARRAS